MRRACLMLMAVLCAAQARADLSASATAFSDFRYRGYSLSGGRPSAQVGVAYDHDSGWFGGLSTAGVRFGADTGWELQTTGFLGVAWRLDSGASVEAGASRSVYTASHDYNYNQFFTGLAWREVLVRVYYAADYYQQGRAALYTEAEARHALDERVTVRLHLGALHADPFSEADAGRRATSFDALAGVEIVVDEFVLGAAWSVGSRRPLFRDSASLYGAGSAFAFTASRSF